MKETNSTQRGQELTSNTQTISNNGQQITIAVQEQRETLPEPTKATNTSASNVLCRCLLAAWISAIVTQSLSFLPWHTVTKERLAAGALASALVVAGADAARRKAATTTEYIPSASYAASVLAGALLVL